MKRAVLVLASLAAMLIMVAACCPKAKIPPQPPIPPPAEEKVAMPETIPPAPTPTTVPPLTQKTYTLSTIHFDFDKFAIRPGVDAKIMDDNAAYLRANPGANLVLEGYCDPIGTEEYNRGLGLRRANSARDYLVKLGIEGTRLSVVSYGKEKLVTTNEKEFELNRRVEFKVK